MDYQFPQQLFPSFYNRGPPDTVLKHCAGNWGCYDLVRPQGSSGPLSSWTFTSRHQVRGETWRHTEPVPIPLLSPKNSFLWSSKPPDPLDFTEHMQNFFMDHCQDAFGCMSEILGEHFNFKKGEKEKYRKDSINMWKMPADVFLQINGGVRRPAVRHRARHPSGAAGSSAARGADGAERPPAVL